ncbi:hypothetical protein [Actinokineospora terrae]|uniref:Uncharacterized protein n=1 Tax=Actinokineospora terrae TaxID=155974 RepID=A0A1H9KJ09_9PSEU|nr:hypothetical protein [Actinokineospora terrae]SEQ99059.1 hypothetical protein SAMN04487818_101202 [Actinokineospora terrae]
MGEHEEWLLGRDLVELGRAMDRPPSPGAVATIVAKAAERAPRPPRIRVLLAAAAVVGVLVLSVHADDLLRVDTDSTGARPGPNAGDCSAWAAMDVVSRTDLTVETGWSPPADVGMWTAHQYFTRPTSANKPAAMVQYTRGEDMLTLEFYPPPMRMDPHPMGAGDVEPTEVGSYPAQWARPRTDSFYRVNTTIESSTGVLDRVSIICDGSRLTWLTPNGTIFALSGTVQETTLVELATSMP